MESQTPSMGNQSEREMPIGTVTDHGSIGAMVEGMVEEEDTGTNTTDQRCIVATVEGMVEEEDHKRYITIANDRDETDMWHDGNILHDGNQPTS
jgi:hypothetical protein